MKLRFDGIVLRQGAFELRADLELKGEALGICGPSGSGKTTLLELIAGLRSPQAGEMTLEGRSLLGVPARERHMGYVPQDADLFPHLGVTENIKFGMTEATAPAFDEVVVLLKLETLLGRDPATLSGGERRRVALGRALLAGSRLLLLDEPFNGLDLAARRELRKELKALRQRLKIPLIMVSHDAADLRALCQVILKMEGGRLR